MKLYVFFQIDGKCVCPLECIFIALLALSNEGVHRALFLPYGGTNAKAPKRKNIASLAF